jgi:MFS transporter, VNT family, synaptic vesicle glycoprotein 2
MNLNMNKVCVLLTDANFYFLGIVVSSHFWGYLADTRGRRKVILYTVLLSNLCTLIASVAVNYEMLIAARFFTGFL